MRNRHSSARVLKMFTGSFITTSGCYDVISTQQTLILNLLESSRKDFEGRAEMAQGGQQTTLLRVADGLIE